MKPKIKPDKIRGQKIVSLAFAEDRMHLGIARTSFGSALDFRYLCPIGEDSLVSA